VEEEAIATPMEGHMDGLGLVAAVVSEEVSAQVTAQVTAVAADTEEASDGAVRIRPRAHGMEGPPMEYHTR